MNINDLTNAIVGGINSGGEQFLEGTLAAALPIIWILLIGLHLSRPYILDMIDRFTLRLGADLLWLIYIALRDFLVVSGVVMSFMFFFPDVVITDSLPLTGGLAAVALFGVLIVKLTMDADHDARAFNIISILMGLGAAFYFIPYLFGVQANNVAAGNAGTISNFLVTSSNHVWAVGMAYLSVTLLAIMGAYATYYVLKTGGRAEVETPASSTSAPSAAE